MYYIVQDRLFNEDAWDDLIVAIERLELDYEIVQVLQFIEDFEFKTNRKDVFCFDWKGDFFARPTLDSKVFTGKVFTLEDWKEFRNRSLIDGHSTSLTKDTDIQVSTIKKIQKEFRFFIVNGKIVTGSLYREGFFIRHDNIVDDGAKDFCNEMIKLFQLAPTFVMDIAQVNGEYKIIECGCTNCAGFYKANLPSLLMAIEDHFNV